MSDPCAAVVSLLLTLLVAAGAGVVFLLGCRCRHCGRHWYRRGG